MNQFFFCKRWKINLAYEKSHQGIIINRELFKTLPLEVMRFDPEAMAAVHADVLPNNIYL